MSIIRDNLLKVENRIAEACRKSGRPLSSVTLIAVSKTKPVEDILEAFNSGCVEFGENKVQELTEKAKRIDAAVSWHLIGHLQANKVKYLPGITKLIHSVDSEKLAHEINKQAQKHGLVMDILLEVNVAGEESKFGLTCQETPILAKKLTEECEFIRVKGLMTVAPRTDEPESNRKYFVQLRELLEKANVLLPQDKRMSELSMGMSQDYDIAIEEGATLVRVGSSIFGPRSYEVN